MSLKLTTQLGRILTSFVVLFLSIYCDFCAKKLVQSYFMVFIDFRTLCTVAHNTSSEYLSDKQFLSRVSSHHTVLMYILHIALAHLHMDAHLHMEFDEK